MTERRRPDMCCRVNAAHKSIKVDYSDPADRTHHWQCHTPVLTAGSVPDAGTFGVQVCGSRWVTKWREDTHDDAALARIVDGFTESLNASRLALRDALLELASAAQADADAAWPIPIPDRLLSYPAKVRKVERAQQGVESAEEDLRVWRLMRDMQLSRRDTVGSASAQHFIDTGNYLDLGHEAVSVDG